VRLGEKVRISAVVKNASEKPAHVFVDARVHFVKKKGPSASTVKVFKLGRVDLPAGETTTITRAFPMQHRTIRELHGGVHRVEVQVNGRVVDAGSFDLWAGGLRSCHFKGLGFTGAPSVTRIPPSTLSSLVPPLLNGLQTTGPVSDLTRGLPWLSSVGTLFSTLAEEWR
jgi:hypothetical protein